MAAMTAEQTAAELQRKKNLGIAPTSAANNAAYGKLTAQPVSASVANAGATATPLTGGMPSGGGFMGVAGAINSQNNSIPGAMSGAMAGIPSTGIPSTPTVPTPSPSPAPVQQTAQPMSYNQTQQPAPDYAALAAARTALALQQKTTIANQQKTAAQTSYDQQNLRTKDDRVLGDFNRTQTANPFASMGRTSFNEAVVSRERTQADADASSALATQKGNIDQMLADYQNATEDEKVRIMDELQRADRAYNLDLAKFNQDQSNWDKTFGQNQQQIDYSQSPTNPNNVGQNLSNYGQTLTNSLNELKLGNYSEEQKQQAQLFEQQIKTGQMTQEAAEYNLKELKDPKSTTNQAKALDLQMKQLEAKNLPEQQRLELQQLKKQIAQIGVVHYKPQTATEIEADKLQLRKLTAEVNKLENPDAKSVPINQKDSTDAYSTVYQDINDTKSLEEAYALVEANKGFLTDSDYRSAKEDARKKYEVKKDAKDNKYVQ